jgi:hypothetical protein
MSITNKTEADRKKMFGRRTAEVLFLNTIERQKRVVMSARNDNGVEIAEQRTCALWFGQFCLHAKRGH